MYLTREFKVHVYEDDVLLWEHANFPQYCLTAALVGKGENPIKVEVGSTVWINNSEYFVCEIECRPSKRQYVPISRTIRTH